MRPKSVYFRLLFFLLFSFILRGVHAQLCNGSLGDPVVNIDFGNGSNANFGFSPPGYTYTTSTCPNDGYYTIATGTSGCFGNAWHNVCCDHTGGGAFMLINASYQPADFFVGTVHGLCPNTSYQFSAWIMNVLISPTGIKPNVTFTIETTAGVLLYTYNTGDILVDPTPTWKEYGFYFTTTAGVTDAVIRIRNNAPGGNGNDLALDDITFRPCGPVTTASITGGSNKVDMCEQNQTDFDFTSFISSGFNNPVFSWQVSTDSGRSWTDIPGANTTNFHRSPSGAGHFWYRMSVAESGSFGIASCRVGSNVLEITVHPTPLADAGKDHLVIIGNAVQLLATASGENISVNWIPPTYLSNPDTIRPVVTPLLDTHYQLQVTSSFGCTNSDDMWVHVADDVYVPTGFTPNGDGKNDYWEIPFLDPARDASVSVYNRSGQLMYQVRGAPVKWDGKYKDQWLPAETYVYWIHFRDGAKDKKGTVTLIR